MQHAPAEATTARPLEIRTMHTVAHRLSTWLRTCATGLGRRLRSLTAAFADPGAMADPGIDTMDSHYPGQVLAPAPRTELLAATSVLLLAVATIMASACSAAYMAESAADAKEAGQPEAAAKCTSKTTARRLRRIH